MHNTYCVSYQLSDDAHTELYHGHADAHGPEEAAFMIALEAAQKGIDVTQEGTAAVVRSVLVPPPALRTVVALIIATGAKVVMAGDDPLHPENIKTGVAESVGGKMVDGNWEFPSPEAESEYAKRLAKIMDAAVRAPDDTGPSTHLH